MRVLVLAPSTDQATRWARSLRHAAFAADAATSDEEAEALLAQVPYDAVVFSAAGVNGDLIGSVLDHAESTAAIAVTGQSDATERLSVLAAGAEDVISFPLSRDELVLRVANALVRRSEPDGQPVVSLGALEFDRLRRHASVGGSRLELSPGAFCVLDHLVAHRDRVVTQSELLDHCWDARLDPFANPLPSQIHRIRRALRGVVDLRWLPVGGYRIETEDGEVAVAEDPGSAFVLE